MGLIFPEILRPHIEDHVDATMATLPWSRRSFTIVLYFSDCSSSRILALVDDPAQIVTDVIEFFLNGLFQRFITPVDDFFAPLIGPPRGRK